MLQLFAGRAGLSRTWGTVWLAAMVAPVGTAEGIDPGSTGKAASAKRMDVSGSSKARAPASVVEGPPDLTSRTQAWRRQWMCRPRNRQHWLLPKQTTLIEDPIRDSSYARQCIEDRSSIKCPPELLPRLFGIAGDQAQESVIAFRSEAQELAEKGSATQSSGQSGEASRLREKARRARLLGDQYYLDRVAFYQAGVKLPRNPSLDETLAALGALHYEVGRLDLALGAYRQLIRDVPSSHLVPSAYLAIGEILFLMDDWKGADQSLSMVLGYPFSEATPCAIYMEAWTDFKRGFTSLSRKSFAACSNLRKDDLGIDSLLEHVSRRCAADAVYLGLR